MGSTGRAHRRVAAVVGVAVGVALTGAGSALPAHAGPAATPAPAAASEHGLGALPGSGRLSAAAGLAHLRGALPAAAVTAPPAAVDLSAYTAPVGDQGRLNSCTTWAIDYAMLGWYANRAGRAGAPYAPMYAYSQMQAKYGWSDGGGYPADAYAIAAQQGIDPQADYPQGSYDWRTQPTAAQRANAARHRTTGFTQLYASYGSAPGPGARTAISAAIAAGHPVALSMAVYAPFFSLTPAQHVLGLSGATGPVAGYHEVLVVGYDTAGVRIQNSWGTGWGDRGFADLTWDFVQTRTIDASIMTGFADAPPAPVPTVGSVGPATGPVAGGTTVTLRGTGLTGATAVTFAGVPGRSVRVLSDSALTVVAPALPAGPAAVQVQGRGGSSRAVPGFTAVAPPRVDAVTAPTGRTGTTVTLTGAGLGPDAGVLFDGVPAAVTGSSPTALRVVAPRHAPGAVTVQVVTAYGTATGRFTYTG